MGCARREREKGNICGSSSSSSNMLYCFRSSQSIHGQSIHGGGQRHSGHGIGDHRPSYKHIVLSREEEVFLVHQQRSWSNDRKGAEVWAFEVLQQRERSFHQPYCNQSHPKNQD